LASAIFSPQKILSQLHILKNGAFSLKKLVPWRDPNRGLKFRSQMRCLLRYAAMAILIKLYLQRFRTLGYLINFD
jgi:hypothetical protein